MDHCKDSENVIMHSILCVKLEPFDENVDCTQNLDPLQPDGNVHTQMELLKDFKTEIETDCSDQTMKNDLGDTGTKMEEINVKTEYIGNEASALDNILDSSVVTEDDASVHIQLAENSSKHTEHLEIQKQTDDKNNTTYQLSHSCEPQHSDVISENSTNDGRPLNVTSSVNHSRARSDTCSSAVDILRIHKHSTSDEEEPKQSSSHIAQSLPHPSCVSDVSDMEFKNSRDLVSHKVVHTGQKSHICDVCKKGFSNSSHLARHKRIHTGQTPYVCEYCTKGFSDSSALVKHKRIHTGQKPYVCSICQKGFTNSSYLITHERVHLGQKPYACDICKRGFSNSSYLLKHKRTHTGQKPYVCDICKKGFSTSSYLITHKRIHTGQKPYACDICKKEFGDSSALIRHKRIHTGQKPYDCEICKKGFSQSSNLVAHIRTHHSSKPCV